MTQTKLRAVLRTCASCEWVFKAKDNDPTCPICGFGSYGALQVYGRKAYTYEKTQRPWKEGRLSIYKMELDRIVRENTPTKRTPVVSRG